MNPTIQRIREVQADLRAMSHIPEIRDMCQVNDDRLQLIVNELAQAVSPVVASQQPYPYEG